MIARSKSVCKVSPTVRRADSSSSLVSRRLDFSGIHGSNVGDDGQSFSLALALAGALRLLLDVRDELAFREKLLDARLLP